MEEQGSCESCGKKAMTHCDICGAHICRSCKKRVGCKICGGETRV